MPHFRKTIISFVSVLFVFVCETLCRTRQMYTFTLLVRFCHLKLQCTKKQRKKRKKTRTCRGKQINKNKKLSARKLCSIGTPMHASCSFWCIVVHKIKKNFVLFCWFCFCFCLLLCFMVCFGLTTLSHPSVPLFQTIRVTMVSSTLFGHLLLQRTRRNRNYCAFQIVFCEKSKSSTYAHSTHNISQTNV